MLVEVSLHEKGGYNYFNLPALHLSEKRRFVEGVIQQGKRREDKIEEQRLRRETGNDSMAKQKKKIQDGHKASRSKMLDEINREAVS